MRKVTLFTSFVALLMVFTLNFQPAVVRADWDPTNPYTKYAQIPDRAGMNVNATYLLDTTAPVPPGPQPIYPWQKILADDFICTQTGPITDIHIWGSWLNDKIPYSTANPNVQNVSFKLSLHTNVPANPTIPGSYSHPGDQFWSAIYTPGQYTPQLWLPSEELFYEPNTNQIIGQDHQIWLYNFDIKPDPTNPTQWPYQYGTAANPQIYWLDVQAIVPEPAPVAGQLLPDYVFGWKTSLEGFNFPDPTGLLKDDDAVFGDTNKPGGEPVPQTDPATGLVWTWKDMHYPTTGPYQGSSINLAFVITTVPEPSIFVLLGMGAVGLAFYVRHRKKEGRDEG